MPDPGNWGWNNFWQPRGVKPAQWCMQPLWQWGKGLAPSHKKKRVWVAGVWCHHMTLRPNLTHLAHKCYYSGVQMFCYSSHIDSFTAMLYKGFQAKKGFGKLCTADKEWVSCFLSPLAFLLIQFDLRYQSDNCLSMLTCGDSPWEPKNFATWVCLVIGLGILFGMSACSFHRL